MTSSTREIDPTDPPALAPGEVFVKRPFGGVETFHTRRCQNLVQMARAYVVPATRVPDDASECTHCRGEHRGPRVREQDWSFQASLLGGEVGPDGKTIVTDGGEAADCGRCGSRHPSMEAAMRCCDDVFDEAELVTDGGEPIPGLQPNDRGWPDDAVVNQVRWGEQPPVELVLALIEEVGELADEVLDSARFESPAAKHARVCLSASRDAGFATRSFLESFFEDADGEPLPVEARPDLGSGVDAEAALDELDDLAPLCYQLAWVLDDPEPLTDGGEVLGGLRCPVTSCGERFHDHHDESAVATLVYHLGRAHPDLLEAIESKLGGGRPRTDGGVDASPYTVPTGPGYVTVARVSRGPQISIGIGTAPVDWSGGTSVECWVDRGAIAVDEPDGQDRERIATHTVYQRPSRGIGLTFTTNVIESLDVEVGDDVRIYERDGGGFWLVPADDDPFLEAP